MTRPRLGVLGSGKGSNFAALQSSINNGLLQADIAVVLSDVENAGILSLAHQSEIHCSYLNPGRFRTKMEPEREAEYVSTLQEYKVDLVILAGFMRVIKSPLLDAFPSRILNIHPSLLPAFKGLEAWKQALDAGATVTGCTVHLVDASVDGGKILAQERVPIHSDDTPETLHARIQIAEHHLFPLTIANYWQEIACDQ